MADILLSDAVSRREQLLGALERAGHVVSVADSRAQALAVASHAPDLGVALVAPEHLDVDGPAFARAWRGALTHGREPGPELHLLLPALRARAVEACLNAGADAVHDRDAPAGVIAAAVGAALRRQRAVRALRASCDDAVSSRLVDGATGLFNHRYLRLRLREEVERCGRHPRELALMLIEIQAALAPPARADGVLADAVLAELAHRAREVLRSYDLVARSGSWGLAVLLPDLPLAHAHGLGKRLLAALRGTPVVVGGELPYTVRARMGIAGAAGVDEELLAADVFETARGATKAAEGDGAPVLRRVVSLPPTTP